MWDILRPHVYCKEIHKIGTNQTDLRVDGKNVNKTKVCIHGYFKFSKTLKSAQLIYLLDSY